ncbi:Small glutamine-rich tetratricopeptide repeat-containing protein beta [Cucumispora dikerogammari]|nr:Small glutamine-rich tetratricopeptide repeat-containing protein beta [Cucumispora dikerogammari]
MSSIKELKKIFEENKNVFTPAEYKTIEDILKLKEKCSEDKAMPAGSSPQINTESEQASSQNQMDSQSKYKRAMAHKNEGNTLFKQSFYTKALEEYTKAIELVPDNEIFYSNRAACFQSLLKWDEAIADCEKAIEINSSFVKAYIRLGALYSLNGDKSKSKANYNRALSLDPENLTASEALKELDKPDINNDTMKGMQEMFAKNPEMLNKVQEMFQKMSPEERENLMKNIPRP